MKHYLILFFLLFGQSLLGQNWTCVVCKEPIVDRHLIDLWGNRFHTRHGELPRCYSCSRIIHPNITGSDLHASGGATWRDGRHTCNICFKSGDLVHFPIEANELLKETLTRLRKMEVIIPDIYNIRLVDEEQMASFRSKQLRKGERNPAMTSLRLSQEVWQNKTVVETKIDIYILSSMHKLLFLESLVHELLHVWIYVNCLETPEPAFKEGLCNFFAYEMLRTEPYSDYRNIFIKSMEHNEDPIYGIGFRKVKALHQELVGYKNLLSYIKYNKRLPE